MTREDVTRRTPAIKGAKAPRSERKETPQGWSHWNWSREWRCPGAGLPTQSTGRAAAMVLLDGEARHTVKTELRPGGSDQEGGPHGQEDQSDVADEMLVERPRRRHPRHREVPIVWRVEHEEAVRLGHKAEHDGYAETKPFQHHRSRLFRGRTCGEP